MALRISKRYKRLITTIITIALVASSAYILGWSSFLTVNQVIFNGTTSSQVLLNKLASEGIEPQIGSKLARVETRNIKHSLDQLDWLSTSNISRDWIGKRIIINVVEREAVAKAVTYQNTLVNFDSTGSIFTPTSGLQLEIQNNLPLVTTQGSSKEDLAAVALLLKEIPTGLSFLITDLESISVTKARYIQMNTKINMNPIRIIWGTGEKVEQKCGVLVALLKLPENQGIKQVDLSQPNAPIVS